MNAARMFGIAALWVAAGAAHGQLTAPGGAQPGMQPDGEGRYAVPFLRMIRPAGPKRAPDQQSGTADRAAGPVMGRSTAPGATMADRDVPAGMAGWDRARGAPGGNSGDESAYPR